MNKKHVLITGGNKGIGLETTRLFLDRGFKVTVIARDFSAMQKSDYCNLLEFDLQNIEKIRELVSKLGDIDVLVNNAGVMNTFSYDSYPDSEKARLLKVNLEAPVELITCVSESMVKKGSGRIVNVASVAGHIGYSDIWYGITKAGLLNATKGFAKLLGPKGIVINAVAPGPVDTEMINLIPEKRQEWVLKNVFTGRFAKALEVAQAVIWLATESPEYINGTCIDITNGSYIR